jgi:hypothetical protein
MCLNVKYDSVAFCTKVYSGALCWRLPEPHDTFLFTSPRWRSVRYRRAVRRSHEDVRPRRRGGNAGAGARGAETADAWTFGLSAKSCVARSHMRSYMANGRRGLGRLRFRCFNLTPDAPCTPLTTKTRRRRGEPVKLFPRTHDSTTKRTSELKMEAGDMVARALGAWVRVPSCLSLKLRVGSKNVSDKSCSAVKVIPKRLCDTLSYDLRFSRKGAFNA